MKNEKKGLLQIWELSPYLQQPARNVPMKWGHYGKFRRNLWRAFPFFAHERAKMTV